MAIKVNNNVVIDNSRNVDTNVISGLYGELAPNAAGVPPSLVIDLKNSSLERSMTGDETFTFTGLQRGRVSILTLNTTTSGHTPSFTGIYWAGDTEPVWSNKQYWMISFICWDSNVIHANAIGFD